MIYDHISNYKAYAGLGTVYDGLCYLATVTLENMPAAPVELQGDALFANPVSITTKFPAECRYEIHKKYADIHFVLEGAEQISIVQSSKLHITQDFQPEGDIAFGDAPAELSFPLQAGYFLVTYPQDGHKVGAAVQEPAPLRKIVIKAAV